MQYLLELKNISKAFSGVQALDHVSLKVRPGTVHALMGENGAGKSTLIKIINGLYPADAGEVLLNGEAVRPRSPGQMLDMGIATIYQELSPVLELSIAENIYLGREPLKRGRIDWKKMYDDAGRLMNDLNLPYNVKRKMKEFSISDMQLIEMVKAISRRVKLVIMDEPTSSITDNEVEILFKNIRNLRDHGIGIIYISHKMEEIHKICDDITVFRDGKWVFSGEVKDVTDEQIIELMVGRKLTNIYPKEEVELGEKILEIKNFSRGKKFSGINLSVCRGEVVGMAGLVGAGRSELFNAVTGIDRPDTGDICLSGKKVTVHTVSDAIKNGIIMTPEDRRLDGVFLNRPIRENISISNLTKCLRGPLINHRKENTLVAEMIGKLSIRLSSAENSCKTLSGGNQQKVVLARWLLCSPRVLILDEPTRGIDVGAKYEIYKIIGMLAKAGCAIVVISSELPELIGICDRIVVMSNGKITGQLSRSEFSQEQIMRMEVKGFEKR